MIEIKDITTMTDLEIDETMKNLSFHELINYTAFYNITYKKNMTITTLRTHLTHELKQIALFNRMSKQ